MTTGAPLSENQDYLTKQLITYIGNKRALLPFIGKAVSLIQNELGKEKLDCLDIFSGSGIVSRYLKQYARTITTNDLETYATIINTCYLSNIESIPLDILHKFHTQLCDTVAERIHASTTPAGFISELYAPKDGNHIQAGERCFYTPRNAAYLDYMRSAITEIVPTEYTPYFVAPLLSEASVHANTSGVFKGFYKNSKTNIGQFGGNGQNALTRITGDIELPFPVFSNYTCPFRVFQQDALPLSLQQELYDTSFIQDGTFDIAYLDPPYNQHPYGSNYFMLNLLATYSRPDTASISRVSGIPRNWNRSIYNKRQKIEQEFTTLVHSIKAKYIVVSFNSDGFIQSDRMIELLRTAGTVTVLQEQYNTFRGSRNLRQRNIHTSEFLYILKK